MQRSWDLTSGELLAVLPRKGATDRLIVNRNGETLLVALPGVDN